MRDWKAAVRRWEHDDSNKKQKQNPNSSIDMAEVEQLMNKF